jgi:hypothetical protein
MWTYPPAKREAATGIFLRPAWGLYDIIKGDIALAQTRGQFAVP